MCRNIISLQTQIERREREREGWRVKDSELVREREREG